MFFGTEKDLDTGSQKVFLSHSSALAHIKHCYELAPFRFLLKKFESGLESGLKIFCSKTVQTYPM